MSNQVRKTASRPIKIVKYIMLVSATQIISMMSVIAQSTAEAVHLNNEGVKALMEENWISAINKFEAALKADKAFEEARSNLAIAHSNFGLFLRKKDPAGALRQFHLAEYIDSGNPLFQTNLRGMIRSMGRNPDNFLERLRLANAAKDQNDLTGAVVEFKAALKLKNDAQTHKRLADVYRMLNESKKAASEYAVFNATRRDK